METLKWPNKFEQINYRLSEQHQQQRLKVENEHIISKSSLLEQIGANTTKFEELKLKCKNNMTRPKNYEEQLIDIVSRMNQMKTNFEEISATELKLFQSYHNDVLYEKLIDEYEPFLMAVNLFKELLDQESTQESKTLQEFDI